MAQLQGFLSQLAQLSALHATLGLVVAGGIMLMVADWRLSLLALSGQYLLVGILLGQVLLPQVASVKVLVGAMVCTILYLTALRVHWGAAIRIEAPSPRKRKDRLVSPPASRILVWDVFPISLPFRFFALLLQLAVSYAFSRVYPAPGLSPILSFAFYWLLLSGFLLMAICRDPFRMGLGLFTLGVGVELFHLVQERSLVLMGLLGIINLMAALAISYLMIVEALNLESSRGEGS